MSFDFQSDLRSDAATVRKTICDEKFLNQMAARFGGSVEKFSKAGTTENPKIHTTLLVPTENFPESVRGFISDPLPMTVKADFTGEVGQISLNPARVPADTDMTVKLTDREGGSHVDISGQVTCTVPLMGNRIAAKIASSMPAMLRQAFEVIDSWDGSPAA